MYITTKSTCEVQTRMATFKGMHGSPAKHQWRVKLNTVTPDKHKDRQTPDKVIPMCRYALHGIATQKKGPGLSNYLDYLEGVNVESIEI